MSGRTARRAKWKHVPQCAALVLWLAPAFAQRVITTVAGTDWLFPGDGRPALNAPLSGTTGLDLAVDRNGNYYIADNENFMVMRVGADGIINVIAGNGVDNHTGDGGLAVNAALFLPTAVAVDSSGNVYIAEYADRIRKVTPDGIITTFAGTEQAGYAGDGGLATQARLQAPNGLAVDSAGNVYIADTLNNRVRKVAPDGIITTVAGNGQRGSSGNNVLATSVPLNTPTRMAVDSGGNLYIVESPTPDFTQASRIRRVDAKGIITTIAGGGFDPADGIPATSAGILPVAVTVDSGNIYLIDGFRGGVRKVDAQGKITTIAGGSGKTGFAGDGGPALKALFNFQLYPAVVVDPSGNILVADEGNERVRKITPDGMIQTVAGNGLFHFSGNGGPAASATLDYPTGIIGDARGNLYITEQVLGNIRRIAPDGAISVYAGTGAQGYTGDNGPATAATLAFPTYMTFGPTGALLFSDSVNCVIRSIDPNGIISTVAGTSNCQYGGDAGPPSKASFAGPEGLAFDLAGELIIADTYNHRIRVILAPPDGRVFTIAGDGTAGFSGDNGSALKAEVNLPVGVRVFNGGIYFSDSGNHRIRRIDIATLIITTVAGNGQRGYSGDGGKATQASLNFPAGIIFDPAGNLYIADTRNSAIRKVDPAGIISTIAGSRTSLTLGDGGPATEASLGGPGDLYLDAAGNLFFTDQIFNSVRAVLVDAPTFQVAPRNLAFTAPAGSGAIDQHIDLTGSIPGVPFIAFGTSSGAASGGWLHVSPMSGNMPASVQVTVDPSSLPAGSYQGTITIAAAYARPQTQTIQVSLTTTAPGQPSLNVKPVSLNFSYVQQSAAAKRSVTVSNLGGGSLAFNVASTTAAGGPWLTVSPGSGSVGAFGSTPVSISASPAGLAPGAYSGSVTFSSASPAQSIVVPVTMIVTAVPQTILIPQSGLSFFAVQGGGASPPQYFNILNTGIGKMPFATSASTISNGPWLSLSPFNGVSDADSPIVPQVRVDVNPNGLAAGVYYGTAKVTAPSADNNPQFVSVVLTVLPPGSKIGPLVQPTGIIFTAAAGGESPGSQIIVVQSTGSAPVSFTSGRVTVGGQSWFTSLPSSGTITQSQPARIVIQPQITGLAPGVYRGALTLSFSDGSTRTVSLVFVVIPSGSVISSQRRVPLAVGTCVPTQLVPVFTLLSSDFNAVAGYPGQVAVKVVDDCGAPMTTGTVIVSFSNGDPPLRLFSLKDGTWAATWTPQHLVSPITVTAKASIPEQNLKGDVQLTGGLQSTDQTPIVSSGGIVNAANFAAEGLLAPGGFVSVFGSKLAPGQTAASMVPLPTDLSGTSVVLAGREAPLLYAADGLVNAVIPYGITVNTTHQVIVSRGTSLSVPQPVTIAAAAPAIFTRDGSGKGQGIIIGIDASGVQTYADAANPVGAGQAIVIYCTGLGEVSPPVTAGSPTPLSPLSNTVNPASVTIGGVKADVLFAGLTPTATGLYQVNARIPPGVVAGSQVPVVITVAGQQSQPVTIAVQ